MDFAVARVLAGMISFVPPTIVLYLALSPALSKQERRYTAWSFAIILILETILYLYFFHIGIFKMEWLSFKKMLLTYWPPLLLATFIISQPYFYQNLFVAGMEGLYISFLHTTCMSVTMVFITKGEFLDYCVLYLFAYSLVYVISAPLLLKFFRDLFFKYRTFSMLAFWKYAAWIPILISTYSAVLALRPGPLPEDNMISRVFQALLGISMAVIMYTGTRQMSHQVHTQQKSHLLGAQMKALSDYTGLLQEMQKRMSIFRHDSRHQLRLLSELIQQGDDEAALTFLDTLHTELQETQLQKWTKNKFINTAVSPGLERMRRAGFDVTVSLPLPQSLPFEIDLGSLMAKAIQISEQALEKQPEDHRIFFMGSHRTYDSLIIIVKHWIAEDDAAEDTDFLRYEPYGQIVPALNAFSTAYDASFRYDLKEHMVSLYLTIPYSD